MNWVTVALASALLLAAQAAGMRVLAQHQSVSSYMSVVWVMAGLLVICVGLLGGAPVVNGSFWYVLPAGTASWGAMYAYNVALKLVDNPGNADAVSSLRTPLVYVTDLALATSRFQYLRMLGVVLSVLCVALLAARHDGRPADTSTRRGGWLVWSALSAAGFACLILFSVEAVRHGNDTALTTGLVLVWAGVLFSAQSVRATGMSGLLAPVRSSQAVLLGTIVVAALGNLALIYASVKAPNAGYATAVSSTRGGILYLAWVATRRARFDALAGAAILGMIVSVALTAI